MSIFTRHAYVPTTILTDKGSQFTAEVIEELTKKSGIIIEHATIKHAQTIGVIERNHQRLKQILKINVATDSPQWDRYVNFAVMAHNTTYHSSLKCTPSEVFHGRVPYNALDLKFKNPIEMQDRTTKISKIVDHMNEKYKVISTNLVEAFHKYKSYYDQKGTAQPLKVNDFVFLLKPKYDTQSNKAQFKQFHWIGPYKVVKTLSNSNYIVRKANTNKTQCVHRIRL